MENIRVVSLDVRSEASVRAAVEAVTRLAGSEGLTALVNNAAVLVFGETMWQTEQQVRLSEQGVTGQDDIDDLIFRSDLRWRLIILDHCVSVEHVYHFLLLERYDNSRILSITMMIYTIRGGL